MNISSESVTMLKEQKGRFRSHLKNLTPLEKIRQLESLRRRYFEILQIQEANGGSPVPSEWRRWNENR